FLQTNISSLSEIYGLQLLAHQLRLLIHSTQLKESDNSVNSGSGENHSREARHPTITTLLGLLSLITAVACSIYGFRCFDLSDRYGSGQRRRAVLLGLSFLVVCLAFVVLGIFLLIGG